MTIFLVDGAHHRSAALGATKWPIAFSVNSSVAIMNSRFSPATTSCYRWNGDGNLQAPIPNLSTVAFGFAYNRGNTAPNATRNWVNFYGDYPTNTHHLSFYMNSLGQIQAYRGLGVTLLGTSSVCSAALVPNAWGYYEFLVTLHDTLGSIVVRHNNAVVLNLSGIDTKNGGTTPYFTSMMLYGWSNQDGVTTDVEDLYLSDTLEGEIRVEQLVPNGNGAYSDFVGSDGNSVDNWALVDEVPPAGADYIEQALVGAKNTSQLSNLSSTTGELLGVNVIQTLRRADAGPKSARRLLRSGGADDTGPDLVVPSDWGYPSELLLSSPFTGVPWTHAEVNALELGAEVRT